MKIVMPLILIILVEGCAIYDSPVEREYSLTVTSDDQHYISSALDTAGRRFFQSPARLKPVKRSQNGASPLIDINEDTLSSAGGVEFSQTHSRKTEAAVGLKKHLSGKWHATTRARLFAGQSSYHLPQGAGVLTDPIDISFRTRGAGVEAGLLFETGDRVISAFEIGAGQTYTRSRTHIRSALLDVRSDTSNTSGFVYSAIQVGLRPAKTQKPSLSLRTIAKFYPGEGGSLQTGVVLGF